MKKVITVFGNFGYKTNKLDGQTVRTRSVYEAMKVNTINTEVIKFDTSVEYKKHNFLLSINKTVKFFVKSDELILMPAQRSILLILPLVIALNFFSNKAIHLVAIGGWLEDHIKKYKMLNFFLKRCDHIYVQTSDLKSKLNNHGLKNILLFPNFRNYTNEISLNELRTLEKLENVTVFSRIIKEKGILEAIEAVKKYNSRYSLSPLTLSIYGQVGRDFENDFYNALGDKIIYKGALEPNSIIEELSKQDLMLFPTYYKGEGFPGTILDAFHSGLPVIATDWKYNSEIINQNLNGMLVRTLNVEDIVTCLEIVSSDLPLLNSMRVNSLKASKEYNSNTIIKILLNNLK